MPIACCGGLAVVETVLWAKVTTQSKATFGEILLRTVHIAAGTVAVCIGYATQAVVIVSGSGGLGGKRGEGWRGWGISKTPTVNAAFDGTM